MKEKVFVVDIRFSSRGRVYSYLIDEQVQIGDYVHIPKKEGKYKVIGFKKVNVDELPVPLEEMVYCEKMKNQDEECFCELLKQNPVLHKVEANPFVYNRENIMEELLISLNKRRMKNVVLIGKAGCGKTSIVEKLADVVKDDYFMASFLVGEMISGTTLRGQLEEKVSNVFKDILSFNKAHQKKIILFVDEIHMMVSNAGCEGGISMHDMLKTYLTDSNMMVIGATTIREFDKSIRKDKAFMRRMTPLLVSELGEAEVLEILKNFSNDKIQTKLLEDIIYKTSKIPNATNPDISLEVVDRALARSFVFNEDITSGMVDKILQSISESYSM